MLYRSFETETASDPGSHDFQTERRFLERHPEFAAIGTLRMKRAETWASETRDLIRAQLFSIWTFVVDHSYQDQISRDLTFSEEA